MDHEFLVAGKSCRLSLERDGSKIAAVVAGRKLELDVLPIAGGSISLLINGQSFLARMARSGNTIFVAIGADQFCLELPRQGEAAAPPQGEASGKTDGTIKSPMPGLVIKVNVTEGAEVQPGDGLVVVEAMKMEHEMRAAFRGIVDKVHVRAGQQVDAFQPLLELKPAGNGA